jgi:hypothetical protein
MGKPRIIFDLGDGHGIEIQASRHQVIDAYLTTLPGHYGIDVKNITTEED